MSRRIQKLVAWFLSAVLIFSGVNFGTISVAAADYVKKDGDLTLYFKLPAQTTASDWGFNVWEKTAVEIKDSNAGFTPPNWRDSVVGLKEDTANAGWAYVIINGNVTGCQFVDKAANEYNCWNSQIQKEGIDAAYFDPSVEKWYKDAALTQEIVKPTLDDVYYIVGDAPFTWELGELTDDFQLKEKTPGSKIYTITKTGLSLGVHQYKVLQDPADFGWDYQYVSADTNAYGNAVFTVSKTTDFVTITLDKSGAVPVVTVSITDGEDVEYEYKEGDLKLYFKLPAQAAAADWGFNVWESRDVEIRDSDIGFKPLDWNDAVVGLKADKVNEGWAYVIINGNVSGCQFVNREAKQYYCWNSKIQKDGLQEAYFEPSVEKWYKDMALSQEIVEPVLDDVYYIVGDEPFTWELGHLTDNFLLKETSEGSKIYSITKTGLSAGVYQYKIVQDPEDFGWTYGYVSEDINTDGNAVFTIENVTDKVTITLDKSGDTPIVRAVVTSGEESEYEYKEGDLKLYFKLPSNTTAADWGFNVWETEDVEIRYSDVGFIPAEWKNEVVGLREDVSNQGYAYVIVNGEVSGCQFVDREGNAYYCWNSKIQKEGLDEAYFNPSTEKWYRDAQMADEIEMPVLDEIYYIVGDEPFTWDLEQLTDNWMLKETAEGSRIYSLSISGLEKGVHQYKIVQDPADFGWTYAFVGEDTNTYGNAVFTIENTTDTVTFILDKTKAVPTVTATVTKAPAVYTVTVNGGTCGSVKEFEAGSTVSVTADAPEVGKVFDKWICYDERVVFSDVSSPKTTFIMPEGNITVNSSYKAAAYTVTFKDGDKILDTQIVEYGIDAKAPEVPKKEGYTLSWDKVFTGIKEDITVNAVWTINKYTVIFKDGDTVLDTQTVEHGSSALVPDGLEKEGYILTWDKPYINIKEDMVVNAIWTKLQENQFVVKFISDDKVIDTQIVNSGNSANEPEIYKEGYSLKWDKEFSSVTENLVITAIWTINKYTVIFKDGNSIIDTQTVEYGKDANEPEIPKKEGCILSWDKTFSNIKEDLTVNAVWTALKYTVIFKDGESVLDTQTIEYGKNAKAPEVAIKDGFALSWDKSYTNIREDITVNAVWTALKYTVIFKDGETILNTQTVDYGKDAKAPEVSQKEGFVLSWDKGFTDIKEDTIVNAVWTANKYTVIFKDGDSVLDTQTVEYNADAKAPEVLEKEGYSLNWDKDFTCIKEDIIVNAIWIIKKYTVVFKDGDKVIDSQTVEYGESAKEPELLRPGYRLSWDKSFSDIKEDITVKAIWNSLIYKVKFHKNGGEKVPKAFINVKYNQKYGSLPAAKRKGCVFIGWYTAKKGGKKITSSAKFTKTTDQTLYAHWKKVKVGGCIIKKVSAAKKKMTIIFKKVTEAKGYEVVYAENKKFKSAKKISTTSTNITIKKLKSNRTIYVKVRAYKLDSKGRKIYGKYSSVKKIRIK